MKLFVGITDRDWFRFLRAKNAEEMNFWRPKNTNDFQAIRPGELFLFKMKSPDKRICGGAFFVRHTTMPLDLAWAAFAEANGVASLEEFRRKINSIRGDTDRNPTIGCTVLTQPFYLPEEVCFRPPDDWAPNIVSGKSYDTGTGEGLRLYEQARTAIQQSAIPTPSMVGDVSPLYGPGMLIHPRLGQGGFRVSVMDEYQRRCAMTGERTLPVLQAAHIKPYSELGPHEVSNGLFLRSDLHTLFDKGYVTISNDLHIEVSRRIREEFENGREYYAMHGRELKVLPVLTEHRPSTKYLEWHQSERYLGA